MEIVKTFINYLCGIDLSRDIRKTANDMYNEIETLDVDLEIRMVKKDKSLPREVKKKIVDLIEFYFSQADDCINKFSDEEIYEFLKELKARAEAVNKICFGRDMAGEEDLSGRMKIETIDKYSVQIELDNKSIDFLIETLTDLKNEPGVHHLNYDSDTGYSKGFMTRDSLNLILNNRDKYGEKSDFDKPSWKINEVKQLEKEEK